jgi:hypothetical protein
MLLNRAWGRPELSVELSASHAFCVVPDQMPVDQWLSRRGQPVGTGDEWLQAQQGKIGALTTAQTQERTTDVPTDGAGGA